MKRILTTLRVPLTVIVVNFVVFSVLPSDLTGLSGKVIYNSVRFIAVGVAGWAIVRAGIGSLCAAAVVGALLFGFDQVILKGGKLLLDSYLFQESLAHGVKEFSDALQAYATFLLLPVLLAVAGGWIARGDKKQRTIK